MKNLSHFTVLPLLVSFVLVSFCHCRKTAVNSQGPWDSRNLSADSVSFIVVGDWGREGGGSQKPVADRIDEISRQFRAQFIISTGDNFYTKGVSNTEDRQWTTSFENVYDKPGHQLPWYPVLGNHDYQTNPQAQVDYTFKSSRWIMPSRYYSFEKPVGNSEALFVFTDTSPFVTEYYSRQMGDLKQQDTAAQFAWLREQLSNSAAQWKIVVGHHPVYSVGRHGNTPEMVTRFKPLMAQTATDFYLAGHDHSLQYIKDPADPVHYLVSGGGATRTPVEAGGHAVFARSTPGFMVMTLYPKRASFYFYNQRGELLHRTQVLK